MGRKGSTIEYFLDRHFQTRKIFFNDGPDLIWIDPEIFVNQNVSHRDHLRPWKLGVLATKLFPQSASRPSNGLQMMNDPRSNQLVRVET